MANYPITPGQATMANSSPVVLASDQTNILISQNDVETGQNASLTGLRDVIMAQRTTILADSLADGISTFWTQTAANGGTATSTLGEGQLKTSTAVAGSMQLVSTVIPYYPGQVNWINAAIRFGDTGVAGNIRRIGMFTVSGTTPQEGFYFELNGTTLNAVYVKAGVATSVASTSWSKFSTAPFTLDANYHGFEIRYTANSVWFYVDNVLRHAVSGTSTPLTGTISFPITLQNIKTSGATDITLGVRNVGNGRFGMPGGTVSETGLSAVEARAVGGGTPHDSVDSGSPLKIGGYAKTAAPTSVQDGDRVNAWFNLNGSLNVVTTGSLPAGSAIIGKVSIDQTTPGTTNLVALAANQSVNNTQIVGNAISTGNGVVGTGVQRVAIASDNTAFTVNAAQSGTWTVQPGNTANTTAWKVDGSAVTQPVSLSGTVNTASIPATSGGLSTFHLVSAATTNATNLKASAGQVYGWFIYNSNAAARKVVFHNTAGTPTAGASVFFAIVLPPTSGANVEYSNGIAFSTGIAITTVTDLTDAGATAVAANDLIINIFYK